MDASQHEDKQLEQSTGQQAVGKLGLRFSGPSVKKIIIKVVIYVIGMLVSTLGLAMMTANAMGSNAMNTLFTAVAVKLGLMPGVIYTIFNGTFLIVGFLFARRYMGIASVIMILIQGWFIDMWLVRLSAHPALFTGLAMRLVIGVVSFLLSCIGIAFSNSVCLGVAGFEGCLFALADKIKFEYKYLKIISEILYFISALFVNGVFGVMTLVNVFLFGPVMSAITIWFNRTVLTRLGLADERNELSRNRRKFAKKGDK
ncbi:MAG: hypothetical protein H0S79_08330 [Anaerolineaceae bacterium]|nr:hypothetical protein [Anaerolineaceae bacterium]